MTGGERYRYAYRIGEELLERLKVAADERMLSVNWIVHKAIEEYLDRLDAGIGDNEPLHMDPDLPNSRHCPCDECQGIGDKHGEA